MMNSKESAATPAINCEALEDFFVNVESSKEIKDRILNLSIFLGLNVTEKNIFEIRAHFETIELLKLAFDAVESR